jgi:hypothetical protein
MVRLLKKVSYLTRPSHARRDARHTHCEAAIIFTGGLGSSQLRASTDHFLK